MRKPWVIAHRGASGHTPENTLAAFERAVQLGAGFIETDLHLTRDARFVAIHDSTLERTTNGRGEVRDLLLAELRKLDAGMWYDREHMGLRVPTLDEVLEFARKHDVIFYLEVKYDASWGMHHSLVAALQASAYAGRTIVISFDQATLAALRRVDAICDDGISGARSWNRLCEGSHRARCAAALSQGYWLRGNWWSSARRGFAGGYMDRGQSRRNAASDRSGRGRSYDKFS